MSTPESIPRASAGGVRSGLRGRRNHAREAWFQGQLLAERTGVRRRTYGWGSQSVAWAVESTSTVLSTPPPQASTAVTESIQPSFIMAVPTPRGEVWHGSVRTPRAKRSRGSPAGIRVAARRRGGSSGGAQGRVISPLPSGTGRRKAMTMSRRARAVDMARRRAGVRPARARGIHTRARVRPR